MRTVHPIVAISIVTYNSAKHLPALIESLLTQKQDLRTIALSIIDNNSTDASIALLEESLRPHEARFYALKIQKSEQNLGFGRGHNAALEGCQARYFFILNPDCVLLPDTLPLLLEQAERSPAKVAAWEARQLPYEHPKIYNPITFETEWASGAALLIRGSAFDEVKGFDARMFLYCEDVDICYRLRNRGYVIHYVPKAALIHNSYEDPSKIKSEQFFGSTLGNLYLRTRFGSYKDIFEGLKLYVNVALGQRVVDLQCKRMLANLMTYFKNFYYYRTSIVRTIPIQFHGFDYTLSRFGAFDHICTVHNDFAEKPKVSVLIRTKGREKLIRQALQTVVNQTYPNIEVLIVEDGPASLQKVVQNFSMLDIKYHALGSPKGRCAAGNEALSRASGEYFIFLDEDDLFFADHLEQLVGAALQTKKRVMYSYSFEIPTEFDENKENIIREGAYQSRYIQDFCFLSLLHHNYIPILNVLFHRSLYDELGGFDEKIELNEDWHLWVRYSLSERPFGIVKKTTALYRVPMGEQVLKVRHQEMHDYYVKVLEQQKDMTIEVKMNDLREMYTKLNNQPVIVQDGLLESFMARYPRLKRAARVCFRGMRFAFRLCALPFKRLAGSLAK